MARKNPLGLLKDAARETIKDPIGSAGKAAGTAVEQARGTVALGRMIVEQVTKTAAAAVASRVPGRGDDTAQDAPVAASPAATQTAEQPTERPSSGAAPTRTATKKAPAVKKAPAATEAAPAKKAPAARKAAAAKKAVPAAKAPVKKAAPAAKASPASKQPARKPPLSAAEVAAGAGRETITPVGTRGADVATNPDTTDTDLQQVGTEPLMDPATTKAVASEAEMLRRASEVDKDTDKDTDKDADKE